MQRTFGLSPLNLAGGGCHHTPHREIWKAILEAGLNQEGWYLVRSEAALLLLLLLDSESELLRGRLQSLRYTKKLFFTGWFPPLKPLAGKSCLGVVWGRKESVSKMQIRDLPGVRSTGGLRAWLYVLCWKIPPTSASRASSGQCPPQLATALPHPLHFPWQLLALGHSGLKEIPQGE